ncbi:MAG: hypothetical protein K0B00_05915 [Rhodobacteraceae bacterium]|nr:hypothetical protein [Paracoccaceae bacterium]
MKTTVLAMAALIAGSGTAFAQSGDTSPVYANGFVQYEYLSDSSDGVDFGFGDFAVGLQGAFGGNKVGFDLGVIAVGSIQEDFSESALFPTFWTETSFGKFSIGRPRSAMASRIKVPPIAGTYYYTDFIQMAFNVTDMAVLQASAESYGLRYDGSFSGYDVGLSWHHLEGVGGSGTSLTGFVARDYGAFDFALGFEHLQGNGTNETTYVATLGYDVGTYGARLSLGDSFIMPDSAYSVEAFYRPLDWLKVTASYGNYASNVVYGANAEVSFLQNGYAGVGYFDGDGFPSGFTTAYVGWKLNY